MFLVWSYTRFVGSFARREYQHLSSLLVKLSKRLKEVNSSYSRAYSANDSATDSGAGAYSSGSIELPARP